MLAAPSDILCVIAVMLCVPAALAVAETDGIAEFRPVPIAFVASVPICEAFATISDCCACKDAVIAFIRFVAAKICNHDLILAAYVRRVARHP